MNDVTIAKFYTMLNVARDSLLLDSWLCTEMQGKDVFKLTLDNGSIKITVTNFGCTILSIDVPDRKGDKINVVAGYEDIKDYENNPAYFGCIIGRYANRIAGGRLLLDGNVIKLSLNDGGNHLHGGVCGFNKKAWSIQSLIRSEDRVGVVFNYMSEDGEEGYPGNLSVKVSYILNNKNQLIICYHAETDKATPVNLTNHSYFNLTGFTTPLVNDHLLQINAKSYTEHGNQSIPTGNILEVSGTPLDFSTPKRIGEDLSKFPVDGGLNHNFILEKQAPGEMILAARMKDEGTGRTLNVYTDQPGMQVYTANFWNGSILGSQGKYYQKHGAVALESQAFPDSPNHPAFPNTILRPGKHYSSSTIYEFGVQ